MAGFTVNSDYELWEFSDSVLKALRESGVEYITVGQRIDYGWDEDYFDVHIGKFTKAEIRDLTVEFAEEMGCAPEEITVKKNED